MIIGASDNNTLGEWHTPRGSMKKGDVLCSFSFALSCAPLVSLCFVFRCFRSDWCSVSFAFDLCSVSFAFYLCSVSFALICVLLLSHGLYCCDWNRWIIWHGIFYSLPFSGNWELQARDYGSVASTRKNVSRTLLLWAGFGDFEYHRKTELRTTHFAKQSGRSTTIVKGSTDTAGHCCCYCYDYDYYCYYYYYWIFRAPHLR